MGKSGQWSKEVFARNLKYYMDREGINQQEMAKIVGVSAPALCEWLNAKKYPRIDKIEIIANYFGILKSDLIEDKTSEKSNSPDKLALTEGAQVLVDLFNRVPEDKQKMVLEMIRAALGNQE